MNAGIGGFSGGVEAGDRGAPPKISLHATHHVVSGGTDWSKVGCEIEAVAEAGGVNAREAFLQEFGTLAVMSR